MKSIDFKTAKFAYESGLKTDKKALAVINDLGLKDGQRVSEDDLCQLVKKVYGEDTDAVLNDLFNSIHLKRFYVIDFKANRDESDLLAADGTKQH